MMLDRTIAPPYNRSTHFELIKPEKITLPHQADVYFVTGGKQEVIKIEVIFPAGRWFEDIEGVAHFTATLLSKGTKQKSSFQIAQIFDLYGAHLEINPGLDVVSVSLYTLTKNLEPTLALLIEILTEAIFPEKELGQSKTIYLQNLKVNNEKTSFQASKLIRKNLFGDHHPYGKELEEADVLAITQQQIQNHFTTYFKNFFAIVSGKVDDSIRNRIVDSLARLPIASAASKNFSLQDSGSFRQLVDKEGSVQSSIRIGKRFIGRSHPIYFDVLLLNHILGGYFGSRLMKNIREDKGLSYGIYSSIHTLKHDNYLVIGADVNKENLSLTFTEIRKELTRLCDEKIHNEELNTARNHFIGSLQSEITTPFAHADKVKNMLLFNLPSNYYEKLISRLDAITPSDLQHAASLYFQADSFVEVAVG